MNGQQLIVFASHRIVRSMYFHQVLNNLILHNTKVIILKYRVCKLILVWQTMTPCEVRTRRSIHNVASKGRDDKPLGGNNRSKKRFLWERTKKAVAKSANLTKSSSIEEELRLESIYTNLSMSQHLSRW